MDLELESGEAQVPGSGDSAEPIRLEMPGRVRRDQFELEVIVGKQDIDSLGHVNNVVYLRWMQEAAGAHWEAAASPAVRDSVAWVVIRHEIDYKAPAFLAERLLARTWVGKATAATWERLTEIRRVADDKLLAHCRSVYVALDPATGRPRRLEAALRAPFGQ